MARSPYVHGERIERVVWHHARIRPHDIAVQQGERGVTYAGLVSAADRVAAALTRRGVGSGDHVPVCLDRSPELVIALLGILRTGAAYIAMEPGWPAARRATVIGTSAASMLIADDPGFGLAGVNVVPYATLTAGTATFAEPAHLRGTAAACVFYTSGSTGRPKGVLSPHRGTIRTLVNHPDIPLNHGTVFLQAAPLPWDAMSLELWAPLLNGGRCVLLDAGSRILDADALHVAIARGVNSLWLTSSLFNVLADEAAEVFGKLRLLLVGGERVSAPHVRRVLDRFPGLRIINGYGPVESTIFATTHVIRPADLAGEGIDVPIGRPVPHTGITLIDASDRAVPIGELGEIAVSGDGLAIGYLDDPDETARKFVDLDGVRHYRTGDMAAFDQDGNLRYRGRADRQFKINGVRIEPGEVESVLEGHPRITACCAVRLDGVPGHPELACVYSTADGEPVAAQDLTSFAAARLLAAMIPTVLHHVARLPLGANGKVDAEAVLALAQQAATTRHGAAGPAGGADHHGEKLRDEFLSEVCDLLGLPKLGPWDDLFDAGATSLDAVRIASRGTRWLNRRTTIADVYEARSVGGLHKLAAEGAPLDDLVPVGEAPGERDAPLSHAQIRFWLAEQASPAGADNVVVLAYLLEGDLDRDVLHQALRDVVRRHAVLRTAYSWAGREPAQQILDEQRAHVRLQEVPPPPGDGSDPAETGRVITADWWRTPFALTGEPSIRARLCTLAGQRHLLCLHIHHVGFDGWSEVRLIDDLGAAYRHRVRGQPPVFEAAPSYVDYSRWERRHLKQWITEDLPYWRRALHQSAAPVLPAPATGGEARRLEQISRLPAATVGALSRAAGRRGGPAVSALLAVAGRALGLTFGASDVCIGTVNAGRPDPALEPVLGYFVNPLAVPLRSVCDGTVAHLLDQSAHQVIAAMKHGRMPFDELVRILCPGRDRHPWFQVWAVVQHQPPSGMFSPGLTLRTVRIPPPTMALELVFEAIPQPDGSWDLVLSRRADSIDEGTAQRLFSAAHDAIGELASVNR